MRFGIEADSPLTLEEIGRIFQHNARASPPSAKHSPFQIVPYHVPQRTPTDPRRSRASQPHASSHENFQGILRRNGPRPLANIAPNVHLSASLLRTSSSRAYRGDVLALEWLSCRGLKVGALASRYQKRLVLPLFTFQISSSELDQISLMDSRE